MPMVVINDVKDAVVSTIATTFPTMDVYDERMPQGFNEPCFFVLMFPVAHTKQRDRRYIRSHSFDIHYFNNDNYTDLHDMAEQLYSLMELITMDGNLIRGEAMTHEIVDGVLHFNVRYDFHVLRERSPGDKMQNLYQEGRLK